MLHALALAFGIFTCLAFGPKGPIPHERMDTPKKDNANSGRYIYLGDVPKFEGEEIEVIISKMSLTTRVTAHVSQSRLDNYAQQLYLRWKNLDDALEDSSLSLHPLVKISELAKNKTASVQAWATVAEQYSKHILDTENNDIYLKKRNVKNYVSLADEEIYKKNISEAYFKYLFDTSSSPEQVMNDSKVLDQLLSKENSQHLFKKHLGHLFTKSENKKGYLGYLTLVYPIAATTAGPFSQPREGTYDLKTAESMESRWWSDKWQDEFGGFPFLLIEWSGVAFHGPISNNSALDVWFLRRGYVSHGCHRMDSSDVLEFRTLMPTDLRKAANKIKITVLNHFDAVDWNQDGQVEVIDVKYYNVPNSVSSMLEAGQYSVERQEREFFSSNKYAAKFYEKSTHTIVNAPKYREVNGKLVIEGNHARLPIESFSYRPNRIIQYIEEGARPLGYDDRAGKFPPRYFQKY
jgi:hypothetical protein